jgi:hypothetical protein
VTGFSARTPKAALLQEVARSVGVVAWLDVRVNNLREDDQGEPLIEATMFGKQPSVWIKLFEKERAHLARVCKYALDTGVQQEYIDWLKDRGQQLGRTFRDLLTDERLGMSDEQMEAAKTVVQELMQKALTSGLRRLPSYPRWDSVTLGRCSVARRGSHTATLSVSNANGMCRGIRESLSSSEMSPPM